MQKVLLVIRDGWGYRESSEDNAIAQANTPFTDSLMAKYPNTLLAASGEAVGLPSEYMGNSEVGHMTIGSGRIIDQSLTRINRSITDKSFFKNKVLLDAITFCKKNNSSLHLMGLLQTEGVHAHMDHLFALLDLCKLQDFHNVLIHIFTDGRDAPVHDAIKHIKILEIKLQELGFGQIVTVVGRFYAMDRNKKRERTQIAYDSIVEGTEQRAANFDASVSSAVQWAYDEGQETDEFIKPMKHIKYMGFQDNDAVVFRNFRTDRTRQLTQLILKNNKEKHIAIKFVAMTQYYDAIYEDGAEIVFPEIKINNLLGELVSKAGYRQLRISETEKYAHVTFFMNGQIDAPFLNEDRVLIDSPQVETYDQQPEMSIVKLSDRLCLELEKEKYQLVITNFVNGDMVGHTGDADAIKKGIEAVDQALEKTVKMALAHNYVVIVTADHGNAEDQREEWRTSHTTNPVPCIFVGKEFEISDQKKIGLRQGSGLKDIAPTILDFLDISKSNDIIGVSIIK